MKIVIYVKTHLITGLKYLGKTSSKNPSLYKGSGKYWKLHLKTHGNFVSTEILKECNNLEEARYWGEYYSDLFDVVNSNAWANLKPEIGDGGSAKGINFGRRHTDETRKKISTKKKGIPAPWAAVPRTQEQKLHLSEINTGKTLSNDTKEKMSKARVGKTHSTHSKNKMRKKKTAEAIENMKIAQQQRRSHSTEIFITDGVNNKRINDTDQIPAGWIKGRTINTVPPSQKNKRWINNGSVNKMSSELMEGWSYGRIKVTNKGKKS